MNRTEKLHSDEKNVIIFIRNVLIKTLGLFLAINLFFTLCYPMQILGKISLYNWIFPGRSRLPYGEIPEKAYNLSIYNLEAMFASHEISAKPKPSDEYRVILIGDSATWGFLLAPHQTLAAFLNQGENTTPDGRKMSFYNLGYPVMSLTKDLLLLSYALEYEPDLIIWLFTLESFPYDKQLFPPIIQNNPQRVKALIEQHKLNIDPESDQFIQPSFLNQTIVGSRRDLADMIRLQIYGVMWAATGIDQYIPQEYAKPMEDLPADDSFHNLEPPILYPVDLALDILDVGILMTKDIPVLFINEPMFISQGENSQIRYNFYYPRWAFDDFRKIIERESAINKWNYLDVWDKISASEFTNSAVHLSPEGTQQLAQIIHKEIYALLKGKPEN
jgi:hypothetical protein